MSDIEVDDLGSSKWESKIMDEKRDDLIELFKFGKVRLSESGELLQAEYKNALEQCVFDPNNHKEKTILHCLINQYKPYRVTEGGGKFEPQRFYGLVNVFLKAIADRLGEKGLYDTLHRAIELKHFKLLESICKKMEDSKLTRLISNGISFSDSTSSRNCLRAIIVSDPRNISLVKTLVHCAEPRAFQPENSGDGNTPLHDFVSFGAKNLRINRCACHECLRTYPDLIIDEKQYTDEYVKVLEMMIKKFPGALSTANKEGQTPYTLYKKTRPATVDGKPLDGLEFGCDDPPQDLDAAQGDTAEKALLPDEPAEINMLRRTNTSASEPQPESKSKPGEHENWVYSRYLAQRVGVELLESSCSLPSWEKASQAIFGTPRDSQSVFQTHLKMEEALYDGIESAHNFLEFNPILACVELRLENLGQESASSEDPFDTGDLPMRRHIDSVVHRLTPEQTRDENEKYLGDLLKWLREKGVKKILKLVIVDNQDLQCRDETIQKFLSGWDIQSMV
ncbi:hypothetical protein H9Q69_002975 [Fusarium xylarioides]|nr:hypothetical protein H9Q69_002975 [Fusarium xylarioides]